jgi:hypothetical protein
MTKSGDRSTPAVPPVKGSKKQQNLKAHSRGQEAAFDEKKRAASGLTRAFGCSSVGEVPPIDVVIMGRLRAAFDSIDDDLQTACFQRGLLPRMVGDALRMATFLSVTLPSARAAQSATGVPASILIAESYEISGASFHGCRFELDRPDSHDIFNTGKKFKSLLDAFLQRAHWLSKQPAFQSIMRATGDARIGLTSATYPSNFIDLIAAWSKPLYNDDLVNTIRQHDLLECDRMVPVV